MDKDIIDNKIQQDIQDSASQSQFNLTQIPKHTHNGTDSNKITVVDLPIQTPIKLGLGGMISNSNSFSHLVAPGSTSEQIQTSIFSGTGQGGIGVEGVNMQLNLLHQPQNANNQSFITALRPPLFSTPANTTITVSSGGNTVTVSNYGFTTNALQGALINIFNSTGTLVETQTIASNTSSVITIVGTWLNTTTGGTFFVFQPVYLGSADTPFQRVYVQTSSGGGIRFGIGPTAGGQNAMFYTSADGLNLFFRKSNGSVVALV